MVHRDVKPENVLVEGAGRGRLTDFGVATALHLERLTLTGALVGTPAYMAPEQIRGVPPTPAVDVWALGVMLYVALTGEHPFPASSLAELTGAVLEGQPDDPRALGAPRALAEVCLKALRKDPAARYPDGAAFALDLARASRGEGTSASGITFRRISRGRWRVGLAALVTRSCWAGARWS